MKAMQGATRIVLLLGAGTTLVLGQSNSASASYKLLSAPALGGGGQVGNGSNIQADLSVGGLAGGSASQVTAGGAQERFHYIGQLFDITGIEVEGSPLTVDEGGARQLQAVAILDDETEVALSGSEVKWSVLLGPLSGITSSGLATADSVYADAAATVQASSQGVDGQLGLTVLNTNGDDFRAYGGDGLPDDWQVGHFGLPPNVDAAPEANPDFDPYDNLTEFLTGYSPVDPGAFFQLSVIEIAGSRATLELSKVVPGTRYRIERRKNLVDDSWLELMSFTSLSELLGYKVEDPAAAGPRWFYRVGVEPEQGPGSPGMEERGGNPR